MKPFLITLIIYSARLMADEPEEDVEQTPSDTFTQLYQDDATQTIDSIK